jgi:tRNA pseudouridine13 synthase
VALPYLTADLPGIGGVLRATDDDFCVDEIAAYAPQGTGDHVFTRIEKRGLTTAEAVERISRALGVAPRDLGVAGMKDRHAVTRQWISLPPPVALESVLALTVPDVTVLEAARHPHKLRTGHLRGNRFVLRVRNVVDTGAATSRAEHILARLVTPPGAPNWFGDQRFGRSGDNAARGRAIVLGTDPGPRNRKLARLLVSALQSELFNAWLVARVAAGDYARVIDGDLLHKRGGGMFACDDPATDQARLVAGELVVTGPMFGDRMRAPRDGSEAARREQAILAQAELAADAFAGVRKLAEGTRRDASIDVADVRVAAIADDAIEIGFTLPAGAYATVVMREVMKTT